MSGKTLYQIGEFLFEIENPGVPVPENFRKFHVTEGTPVYHYTFQIVERLSRDRDDFAVRKEQICIAIDGGLETRYLNLSGENRIYAVSRELDASHTLVEVAQDELKYFEFDNVFGSLLSLERRQASYGAFVLHSAYMIYNDEAILFTAPSGTGKSTQAELWRKHRGAEVINGDRCLLQFRDGKLRAFGWPVCGSSGICQNRSYPVRAIVVLEQARENRADRLSSREYILRLMREITINYHNREFFDRAMNFIDRLTAEADLWRLQCDISEQAVECLHQALYGEER